MSEIVQWYCAHCARYFERDGLKRVQVQAIEIRVCPTCDGPVREERSRVVKSFGGSLAHAFVFPFVRSTWLWLLGVSLLVAFLRWIPVFGVILGWAIQMAFFFAITRAAARGAEDVGEVMQNLGADNVLDDWLRPLGTFVFACVLAFGPALALLVGLGLYGLPFAFGAGFLGLVYFPAALVVAWSRSYGIVFSPALPFQLVMSLPGPYLVMLGFLFVAVAASAALVWMGSLLADALDGVWLVPWILRTFLGSFGPIVVCRMLGTFVCEHQEELD